MLCGLLQRIILYIFFSIYLNSSFCFLHFNSLATSEGTFPERFANTQVKRLQKSVLATLVPKFSSCIKLFSDMLGNKRQCALLRTWHVGGEGLSSDQPWIAKTRLRKRVQCIFKAEAEEELSNSKHSSPGWQLLQIGLLAGIKTWAFIPRAQNLLRGPGSPSLLPWGKSGAMPLKLRTYKGATQGRIGLRTFM